MLASPAGDDGDGSSACVALGFRTPNAPAAPFAPAAAIPRNVLGIYADQRRDFNCNPRAPRLYLYLSSTSSLSRARCTTRRTPPCDLRVANR